MAPSGRALLNPWLFRIACGEVIRQERSERPFRVPAFAVNGRSGCWDGNRSARRPEAPAIPERHRGPRRFSMKSRAERSMKRDLSGQGIGKRCPARRVSVPKRIPRGGAPGRHYQAAWTPIWPSRGGLVADRGPRLDLPLAERVVGSRGVCGDAGFLWPDRSRNQGSPRRGRGAGLPTEASRSGGTASPVHDEAAPLLG